MSSALDLCTDALDNINASGLNGPSAEDLAKALRKLNLRIQNWNTRERFKRFERMQTFPFTVAKQSYTIGANTDLPTPDFFVASGRAPIKIDHGNWILAGTAPHITFPLEIIEVSDYQEIRLPELANSWPYGIYYQRTSPGPATIWPWPHPTDVTDSLQLFWWDQLLTIALADIAVDLNLPDGYDLALGLTLTEDLCIPFGKDIPAQLRIDAARARNDIQSQSVKPPRMSTDDRSDLPGGWRRGWLGWRRS